MNVENRKYETIAVFSPSFGEAQLQEEIAKLKVIIEAKGGKEILVDNWGKKEIAYTVKKNKFGHFICFKYSTENINTISDIASLLRISETVIKFQSHRVNLPSRKYKGNVNKANSKKALLVNDDLGSFDNEYTM